MPLKRAFDAIFAGLLTAALSIPMLIIAAAVKLSSPGPAFYLSERVGRDNILFRMYKFRTMKTNAPAVATHLLDKPDQYMTAIGSVLRKTSFDEIPQLINILKGEMSFVGPRPALFNQYDLIEMRTRKGIHKLLPGLTGWAQINGRDELPISKKVDMDLYYLNHRSFRFDLLILWRTIFAIISGRGAV